MHSSKLGFRSAFRFLGAAATAVILVGCGSSPAPVITPPAVYPDISDNWQFEVQRVAGSLPPNIPVIELFGTLVSSGNKITGTLNAHPGMLTGCVKNNADSVVTGTIDTSGNMSLTTTLAGGTATLTSTNQLGTSTSANGTYQVVGGACPQVSTTLTGYQVANVSGTYTGTMARTYPTSTGTLTISATLVQSGIANADGLYPLTGTVVYSGDCSGTLTFTNGIVYGAALQSTPYTADFSSSTEVFSASAPATITQPFPSQFFLPDGCGTSAYQGNLTRR